MTIGTSSQKMFSTTKCAVSRSTTKDCLCDRQKQKPKTHMVGGRIPPEMHLPKPPVHSLRPTLVHMEPCFSKGCLPQWCGTRHRKMFSNTPTPHHSAAAQTQVSCGLWLLCQSFNNVVHWLLNTSVNQTTPLGWMPTLPQNASRASGKRCVCLSMP